MTNKTWNGEQIVSKIFEHASSISETEYHIALEGLIDYLFVAMAGTKDKSAEKVLDVFVKPTKDSGTVLLGHSRRADPATAALWNGFVGHVLDFDDVHKTIRGHPSTVLFPTLLALAESENKHTIELLNAYVIGVEVMARLAKALGQNHYERGFHNTSTLGPIAAAISGAYLLGLNSQQIQKAAGIAATRASGLRAHFGSDVKPLHAGFAAQAAVQSVQLAQLNYSASLTVFEEHNSFFSAFGDEGTCFAELYEGWGETWQIVNPGLRFKRYPCCGGLMQAIDLFEDVHQTRPLTKGVKRISVHFPKGADAALIHSQPRTRIEGRFSVEYVAALFISNGTLTIADFMPGPIHPQILDILKKVRRHYSPATNNRFTEVTIEWEDGQKISKKKFGTDSQVDLKAKYKELSHFIPILFIEQIKAGMKNNQKINTWLQKLAKPNLSGDGN